MNRRAFLRWRSGEGRVLELSCETPHMNYLDARTAGMGGEFLGPVLKELRDARSAPGCLLAGFERS